MLVSGESYIRGAYIRDFKVYFIEILVKSRNSSSQTYNPQSSEYIDYPNTYNRRRNAIFLNIDTLKTKPIITEIGEKRRYCQA